MTASRLIRVLLLATTTLAGVYILLLVTFFFWTTEGRHDPCDRFPEECAEGRSEAKRDFEAGRGRLYVVGLAPLPDSRDALHRALAASDADVEWTVSCMSASGDLARLHGYNQVASVELRKTLGFDYHRRLRWRHALQRVAVAHDEMIDTLFRRRPV